MAIIALGSTGMVLGPGLVTSKVHASYIGGIRRIGSSDGALWLVHIKANP